MRRLARSLFALTLLASPALAQDDSNGALAERLDRLERDVNFVQKQVYRSGGGSADSNGTPLPANAGQLQVRFSQIDEEMRQIRGLIEQTQFQNKQTADNLKKLQDDVDYRLHAIEQKQAEAAAAAAAVPAPAAVAEPVAEPEAATPAKAAAAAAAQTNFADANAHYSYAYKLISDKKYAEASSSFDSFVKKYPSDPLVPSAFYWLGESQYARGDFTRSAENFRKGFEANPDGQKAPDNLYKLAMSLSEIKRKTEACVVLNQVVTKYAQTAQRTAAKAQAAITSMQCK